MCRKIMKKMIVITLFIGLFIRFPLGERVFSSESAAVEFVTPCVWELIMDYSEGLAAVKEKNFGGREGKYGFIDRFGKMKIAAQWDEAFSFSQGLAAVKKDGKWGYINQEGECVIPFQFGMAREFNEGIAVVQDAGTRKYGFIDMMGNIVVPLEYDVAYTFANGFGKVRMNERNGVPETYYIFDRNGVCNPDWSNIGEFSEGLAWAVGNAGRGYIDETGNLVIRINQGWGGPFCNGRAHISDSGGNQNYYITKNGNRITDVNYYRGGDFHQGYALVQEEGSRYPYGDFYIIDTDGNRLAKFENDSYAYSCDLKKVWIKDNSNFYSYRAYPYDYDGDIAALEGIRFHINKSSETSLVASKKENNEYKMGVLDKNFNVIIPFSYKELQALSDDYFKVRENYGSGRWGLIDKNNRFLDGYGDRYFNPPSEDRFRVYQIDEGYGIARLFDDGPLYRKETDTIGAAQAVNISVNGLPQKAYKVGNDVYVSVEELRRFGISVSVSKNRKVYQLTRQPSKNTLYVADLAEDNLNIYTSDAEVLVNGQSVDSLQIGQNVTVNINALYPLATVQQDKIYTHRPYMLNEGITWEWSTDLFDTYAYFVRGGLETYGLDGDIGIKIYHKDGRLLYQDDAATSCVFRNGLWEINYGYGGDPTPSRPTVHVNLQGEIVDSSEISPTPSPPPAEKKKEYPVPVYEYKDYWNGSLYGTTHSVPISTGLYADEAGNVVLNNPEWSWTEPFQDGTALVNVDGFYNPVGQICGGKWGLINPRGQYIVYPSWDGARRNDDGNIAVWLHGKHGIVDGQGNEMTPLEYDELYYGFDGSAIKVKQYAKYGLINAHNKILLPCLFDNIEKGGAQQYWVRYSGSDITGQGIIRLIDMPLLPGSVYLNGEKVPFDTPPLLINGRTMIPIRALFEKMGCIVSWTDETSTANIRKGEMEISIQQDKNTVIKNGEYLYSDTAAVNYNDRIYVPIRVISESIGCSVEYEETTGSVYIIY